MKITEITAKLSSLTELTLESLPTVTVNIKSAPRQVIGQLVRQKFVPSYQEAPEDLKWLVKGEGDNSIDETIHVIDLLGVYKSNTNEIILYDLLIRLCSIKLEIDYETLKQIVLIHELSHAITHLGKDSENNIWEHFDIALIEDKEYFAQIYTYKLLAEDNYTSALEVLNKLTETQIEVYQTYKKSISNGISEINNDLLIKRKQIPLGYELYPIALNTKWKIKFDNLQKYESYVGHASFHGDRTHPGPKSIYKTITEGTKFEITFKKISISSYDYSPSSNQFSIKASIEAYKIIEDNRDKIKKIAIPENQNKPIFCITIHEKDFFLNIRDVSTLEIFKNVINVIKLDYPVLANVLSKYQQE